MDPPEVWPPICEISYYECSLSVDSARQDLCDLSDGDTTFGTFDPATGAYTFKTHNMIDFPEGVYTFTITAFIVDDLAATVVSEESTFTMTLTDPCPYANL